MDTQSATLLKQHVIDPEICIRCNTCEATCPVGAVTHDDRNYVVDADKCNFCMACVPPCPTGSIDNWRTVIRTKAYSLEEQLVWDELPAELPPEALAGADGDAENTTSTAAAVVAVQTVSATALTDSALAPAAAPQTAVMTNYSATLPPWSAAHPYTNLYGPKGVQASVKATVAGNVRVTEVGKTAGSDYDTHHIVLDFGQHTFPVLEGQSIGVIPAGQDAAGKPHYPRQYSVASPRNGERAGYNNVSVTVKRVLHDHSGKPVRGLASNFMCDLKVGDTVEVVGPFGSSFLMPNHAGSNLVMICTGTGSAPMRAMTEWRRRQQAGAANSEGGKLMLFFGARTQAELPYFGPLQKLPKDFIDLNLAYSREAAQPKKYVQDLLRERAADVLAHLQDPNSYFYVCGLKAMEEGVLAALKDVAQAAGLDWPQLAAQLKTQARLHLETY